jgi:HEPN domain-containing protein
MSNTVKRGITLIGVVLLAACEQTPVEPQPDAGFQADASAAEAVDASWDLLTTEEDVYLETLEALNAQPNTEAEAAIMQAGDAGEDGYVEASLIVLGPELASGMVADVDLALSRVEDAVAGGHVSPDTRGTLQRAADGVDRARSELSNGNDSEALRAALAAADELRRVDPERRAAEFVQKALRVLEKAKELAGPDPRPEIAELLREADTHCDAAVRALDAGNWELAVREAIDCATLARRVIALLSGGVPSDRLEARAKALVVHAEELYQRAVALAGDDPEPKVERALDKANDFLRKAKEAIDQEDWREAVRLARESISISERVIGYLTGRRDGLGVEPDRPVPA